MSHPEKKTKESRRTRELPLNVGPFEIFFALTLKELSGKFPNVESLTDLIHCQHQVYFMQQFDVGDSYIFEWRSLPYSKGLELTINSYVKNKEKIEMFFMTPDQQLLIDDVNEKIAKTRKLLTVPGKGEGVFHPEWSKVLASLHYMSQYQKLNGFSPIRSAESRGVINSYQTQTPFEQQALYPVVKAAWKHLAEFFPPQDK